MAESWVKIAKRDKLAVRLENPEQYGGHFTSDEIATLLRDVFSYYIDPGKCQASTVCVKRCPVEAIISEKQQVHVIDQEKCIKCGNCLEACPSKFSAVTKISGEPVPLPLPEGERIIVRGSKEKKKKKLVEAR